MATEQLVTVETLQAITDAFNSHDLDAIMEFFAEDSSLHASGARSLGPAVYR